MVDKANNLVNQNKIASIWFIECFVWSVFVITYNVFYGCKKLSKIKINSTKMTAKTLSSKAFAGINKNTIIDVPNSKIKSYKTLFAKKGLPKNVKIK